MQKVDLEASFIKYNENCGLPDLFTDYQIRHLGNPSGLPEILLKIDPCDGLQIPIILEEDRVTSIPGLSIVIIE